MSLEVFSTISTIGSLVSVLSVMTQFRLRVFPAFVIIIVGTTMTLMMNLVVMNWVDPVQHSIGFLLLQIVPIGILFVSVSAIRGFRFGYTIVLSLSITYLINSLSVVISSLFGSMLIGAISGTALLFALCTMLKLHYRCLYLQIAAVKTQDWAGFSIIPLLCLIVMSLLSAGNVSAWFTMDHFDLKVILFAIIAITHVQIALNLQKFHERIELEKNNRLLETMLAHMKQDLAEQIDKIRITKLHRHDLHHHLNFLSAAARHGDLHEFYTYVGKLKERIEETAILGYCSNFSLNAVLSIYLKKAQDLGIKVTHTISLPEVLPVEDIDLSLILANALENAINANEKIARNARSLDLKLYHEFKTLTLIIENPIFGTPAFKDDLPQSIVADHGYGAIGIRSLAQRYHGSALFSVKKGRFTLIVQLPC